MADHRTSFQFAFDNPTTCRDIALAVGNRIDPEELAADFGTREFTVSGYCAE